MENPIQKELSNLQQTNYQTVELHLTNMRTVLTMVSSFLGVLIALRTDRTTSQCEYLAFISAIGLFLLGIFFGILDLHSTMKVKLFMIQENIWNVETMRANTEGTPLPKRIAYDYGRQGRFRIPFYTAITLGSILLFLYVCLALAPAVSTS